MNKQSSHNPARAPRLSRRRFLKGVLAFGAGLAALRFAPPGALDLPVAQAANPDLVWGPYLQSSTPDSMIVTWATRVNNASEVRYSVGGGAENVVAATAQRITKSGATPPFDDFYLQSAKLTGLAPGTTYNYRTLTGGVEFGASLLKPARPASESSFMFVVMGDSGTATANQQGVAARIQQLSPEFVLHCGDIIGYSTNRQPTVYQEWNKKFFDIYKTTLDHIPFFPAIGNHDFQDFSSDGLTPYLNVFQLPENVSASGDKEKYYSFDYGNAHFVVLDVYAPYGSGSAQQSWLIQDLQATTQFWKIVWMQTGPYSSNAWSGGIPGGSEASANRNIRQTLVPIFQQYNVDIVFAGDQHIYERSVPWAKSASASDLGTATPVDQGGIVYVITGGGGAGLGDVQTGANRGAWSQDGAMFKLWHATKITIDGAVLTGEAYNQGSTATAPFDTFSINRSLEVVDGLYSGAVSPESGGAGVTYTFQVTYKQGGGQVPAQATLMLDGQAKTMTKVSGTYSSGAIYQYTTSSLGFGAHQFYFDFGSGFRLPTSGSIAKPTVNDPPAMPAPITPADGAIDQQTNLTLSWSGGDPNTGGGDTVKYDLYLGPASLPANPTQSNLTTTSYTPGALANDTTYYWKVVARDSLGMTRAPANPWSFTTAPQPNLPPSAPSNPSPADDATDVDLLPTLTWSSAIDPEGDPITYEVTLDGVLVATQLPDTSYAPSTLAYGATYTWTVTAVTSGGSTPSEEWRFTTKPDLPPQLADGSVSPLEGTTEDTFTFQVTYSDPYGRSVREAKIFIDDVPLSMVRRDGMAATSAADSDTTVIDGVVYIYDTQFNAGAHTYRFEFINSDGGMAKLPETGVDTLTVNEKPSYRIGLPMVRK